MLTPALADAIAANTNPAGFHYYFAAGDGHPAYQMLVLGGLIPIGIATMVITAVAQRDKPPEPSAHD